MFENGVALLPDNKYNATIKIDDINYQITSEENREDIFTSWMQLLNSNTTEEGFDITIHNHSLDEEKYLDDILLKQKNDAMDHYRDEMNDVMLKNIRIGNNNIVSDKYLSFSIKEDTMEDAYKELSSIKNELIRKLKTLGCQFEHNQILSGIHRLELLHSIFTPQKILNFDYKHLDGNTTKDAISPDSMDFSNKSYFMIENRFCKILFLKSYSTELCDAFISDLSKLQYNFTINVKLRIIEQSEAIELVKKQKASMEMDKIAEQRRAIKNQYDVDMIPEEIKYSLKEADDLLTDIKQRNQRLFSCQFVMMLNCETMDELKELEKRAMNVAKKHNLTLGGIDYLQEQGFQAALPLCYSKLPIDRTLTTSAVATFIPFTSRELMHRTKGAVYYGINAISGNLIMCARDKLLNPTGLIMGKPGGGKSFSAKREMVYCKLSDPKTDVIVIDPEREYSPLVNLAGMNGTVIYVSNTSTNRINPWDGDLDDKNFLVNKVEFCYALTESMVGSRQMTSIAKSLIDRCVRYTYAKYTEDVAQAKKKKKKLPHRPTFRDYYNIMKEQPEPEASQMVKGMETYVEGVNSFFADESNVDINNTFTVYDIQELGETLKPTAMIAILESLWTRIMNNKKKGIKTRVYIDEISLILRSQYCLNFFSILWKRARKYDAIITGITQNVEELLSQEATSTMVSNTEFMILMNQSRPDCEKLAALLDLSDEQITYISNSEEGSGLLYNGKTIIPFYDKFPKDTDLYRAMTTKPEERKIIDNLS